MCECLWAKNLSFITSLIGYSGYTMYHFLYWKQDCQKEKSHFYHLLTVHYYSHNFQKIESCCCSCFCCCCCFVLFFCLFFGESSILLFLLRKVKIIWKWVSYKHNNAQLITLTIILNTSNYAFASISSEIIRPLDSKNYLKTKSGSIK